MQNLFKSLFCALAIMLVVCFTLTVPHAAAQATSGQIVGQVTDPTGAVIPGAAILATDEEKGVTFKGSSNSAGNFTILSMPPGIYTVEVSASGFASSKVTHAVLDIDQHMNLNFKLKVGSVSATVEVTEATPILQTQTANVGTVISGDAIVDIPLEGRNFYDLTYLVPGVVNGAGGINSLNLSVSGQREYSNSVQLDGVETTMNRTQDVTITPNVDSVEEFKVITSSFDAEFGNASGGIIAVQTKAGTNQIHGDAFEFFRPPYLTARQSQPDAPNFVPAAATLKQHDFGGTIGGPIIRNRAFLFGAYEGRRKIDAYSYVDSTIPFGLINIPGNGSVDFSGLLDPHSGIPNGAAPGTIDPIFDPLVSVNSYGGAEAQFSGNIIPANRVSQAGLNTLLNFYPKPNLPGIDNGWFQNYQVYSPVNDNNDQVDSRFDMVITDKDRLYSVFHWQGENSLVTDPYHGNTVVPGGGDSDQANKQDDGVMSISLTYDHIFSPTALNEFRFGYLNYYQDQYSLLNGTDYSTKYGVGNVAVPGFSATIGYPDIYMADGYLAGGSTYKPYHVKDQNYQFTDSFTWSGRPRHNFKFGTDLRLLNSHPNFSLFPTGFDYFDSYGYAETSNFYYTYIPGAYNWAGGSDIADLVLGLPTDVYIGLQLTNPHTQNWDLDLYAQDSFKVTPKLTVNYGIRYEYQSPWVEANDYMSNFDIASGNILLANRGGASRGLVNARGNDFSPRFGIAYNATPKTVFRAGGAIFYSPENDGREDFLTKNVPFATQASYTNWVYNGPSSGPSAPWQYVLDSGIARSTAINIPSNGVINPANIVNGNLLTTYALNPKIKTGTTGSFNVSAQTQLNRTMSLDIAYIGSISRHLSYEIGDINANVNDPVTNNGDNLLTTDLGKIQYVTDAGISKYSSLQVKLTRQMSRNTSFLLSYTWGHSLDNGPAPFDLGQNNDSPQDPYNLKSEWATSDSDVRQNMVFSFVYQLPFGKGQHFGNNWGRLTNAALGGWKFSGIFIAQTGTPINVVRGTNPYAIRPGLRPDVSGNPNLPHNERSVYHYFNTTAFYLAPDIEGNSFLPGNAGRNLVTGPAYVNLDSSLAKEFAIVKDWKLQIKADAFNTSNTVHLNGPDGNFNDTTFGWITSARNARRMQLAAKIIF